LKEKRGEDGTIEIPGEKAKPIIDISSAELPF